MQIGDTLWCHETRSHTKPWFEATITGETRQSWILGERGLYKVNKKTLLENMGEYGSRRWHTTDSREETMWMASNRYKIARCVDRCDDIETLQKVAALIGYDASLSS